VLLIARQMQRMIELAVGVELGAAVDRRAWTDTVVVHHIQFVECVLSNTIVA
jgi:hypothetical protein